MRSGRDRASSLFATRRSCIAPSVPKRTEPSAVALPCTPSRYRRCSTRRSPSSCERSWPLRRRTPCSGQRTARASPFTVPFSEGVPMVPPAVRLAFRLPSSFRSRWPASGASQAIEAMSAVAVMRSGLSASTRPPSICTVPSTRALPVRVPSSATCVRSELPATSARRSSVRRPRATGTSAPTIASPPSRNTCTPPARAGAAPPFATRMSSDQSAPRVRLPCTFSRSAGENWAM